MLDPGLMEAISGVVQQLAPLCGQLRSRDEVLVLVPKYCRASEKSQRRSAAAALEIGRRHAEDGHAGRAGAAFVLALALDPVHLRRAERSQILADRDPLRSPRKKLLAYLRGLAPSFVGNLHPLLAVRLETYEAIEEAASRARPAYQRYLERLRTRPPGVVKTLLAAADLSFMAHRFGDEDRQVIDELLSSTADVRPDSPEEWASVASLCIADIYRLGPLDRGEANAEVARVAQHPVFHQLLEFATICARFRDAVLSVILLGHELLRLPTAHGITFVLRATDSAIEKAYRSALVRQELTGLMRHPLFLFRDADEPHVSMFTAAQGLLRRWNWHELSEEPFHRHILRVPEPNSGVFDKLLSYRYFEDDVVAVEHLDWFVDTEALYASKLTENLTVREFVDSIRPLMFFLELHSAMLEKESRHDATGLWNSAIPVVEDDKIEPFLAAGGAGSVATAEVLKVLKWQGEGFLDLQYTPLVDLGRTNFLLPRSLLSSKLIRNVMIRKQRRVPLAGDAFTTEVSAALRKRFPSLAVGKRLKVGDVEGEVDIALVAGDVLVLFECKHSLPGASTHEDAEVWSDVEHAAEQLTKCGRLIDQIGLQQIVSRWFPGMTARRVLPVVLTSTRLFCGLHLAGIPVRDWHTLSNALRGAIVEVGLRGETPGSIRAKRWSCLTSETFSDEDLLDYLGPQSKLIAAQDMLLEPCSRIDIPRMDGFPMLVRETYTANPSLDPSVYVRRYAELGLREIGEKEYKLGRLASIEELTSESGTPESLLSTPSEV